MPPRLSEQLIDAVLASHPLPIADAVAALDGADNLHQRRDLVVECFRAVIRFNASLALAARLQYGASASGDSSDLATLLRSLRRRHLSDGQWIQLTRSLLRPFAKRAEAHPLPELVTAICGKGGRKPPLVKLIDGLLEMRRTETVAHGGTGAGAEIDEVLARRMPQLEELLTKLGPMWVAYRLVVPLAAVDAEPCQRAWLLMGGPPARGRWRRVDLATGIALSAGEPVIVDREGKPILALHPVALVRRPSPEVADELFVLDGGSRHGARYVAFPSMAEHRISELWSELEPILAGDGDDDGDIVDGVTRPYRGLDSFTAAHSKLFYGRDDEIEEIGNRIRRYPFVTVTGRSGSGKSSLLHAGVFPRLTDHHLVSLRPGPHPTANLSACLTSLVGADDTTLAPRSFAEVLAEAPETLGTVLERWCRARATRLVIAVDQGEELFTLGADDDERDRFAAALASAGYDPDGPIRVVFALREDFFARLATVDGFRGLYNRHVEVITTPDRDALVDTVVAPAARFGYQFEDPELVAAMVDPMMGEVGALPLLSFCADRLWSARDRSWKRLTWRAYRDLGGVEGALATHAEGIFADFTPGQRTSARRVFLRLVTPAETRAVVARSEMPGGAARRDDVDTVIDRLVAARLLTVRETEAGASAVELAHETLISHWQRLRDWLDEDRELIAARHRVADASAHWHAAGAGGDFLLGDGKPIIEAEELLAVQADLLTERERLFIARSKRRLTRRARLKQIAIASLALLVVVASGFAYYALGQREAARQRSREVARRGADLVLLRAADLVERDPAEALAWLATLDLDADTGARARMIAGDAMSRGLTTHLLRFPDRAALRIHSAGDDAIIYLDASGRTYWQSFVDGQRRPLTPARAQVGISTRIETDPRWTYSVFNSDDIVELTNLATGESTALPLKAHEILSARPAANGRVVALLDMFAALSVIEVGAAAPRKLAGGPIHPNSPLIAVTADGSRLIYVLGDGSGEIIDLAGDRHRRIEAPAEPLAGDARDSMNSPLAVAAALAPDGSVVAIANGADTLRLVDVGSGTVTRRELFATAAIESLHFSGDGKRLVSAHTDKSIAVWDMPAGTMIQRHNLTDMVATFIAVSDDGERIAIPGGRGDIHVWETGSGDELILRGHREMVTWLDFSADGRRLTSTSFDGDVRQWQLPSADLRVIELGPFSLATLGFNQRGEIVATSGSSLWIWSPKGELKASWSDPGSAGDPFELPDLDGIERTLSADSDGARAAVFGARVELWRRATRATVNLADGRFNRAAFASSDLIALYADYDPHIKVVTGAGEVVAEVEGSAPIPGDALRHRSVAFTPDARWLVEVDAIGTVRRWSTGDWQVELIASAAGKLGRPDFAADSSKMALPRGAEVLVISVADGKTRVLTGHGKAVESVRFTADDEVVASFSADETVRLWNLASGAVRILAGARGPLSSGSFSADGTTLVTLRWDGLVHLWDVRSGKSRPLPRPKGGIVAIALSADGDVVAGASDRGALYIWKRNLPRQPAELARAVKAATTLTLDPVTGELAAMAATAPAER